MTRHHAEPEHPLFRSRIVWFPALLVAGALAAALFKVQTDPQIAAQAPYVYRWALPFVLWGAAFIMVLETRRAQLETHRALSTIWSAYGLIALGSLSLLASFAGLQRAAGGLSMDGEPDQSPFGMALLAILAGSLIAMLMTVRLGGSLKEFRWAITGLVAAVAVTLSIEMSGFTGDSWALFMVLNTPCQALAVFRFIRPLQASQAAALPLPPLLTEPPARF